MLQKLSLVIPFFNEADSLPELYDRVRQSADACVAAGQIADWELWLIDDGSTDTSGAIAQRFVDADHRVGLIVFRKNRGKAAALQAGFTHASGDVVITMDADLQDDPCEIPRFLENWRKDTMSSPAGSRNGMTPRKSGFLRACSTP